MSRDVCFWYIWYMIYERWCANEKKELCWHCTVPPGIMILGARGPSSELVCRSSVGSLSYARFPQEPGPDSRRYDWNTYYLDCIEEVLYSKSRLNTYEPCCVFFVKTRVKKFLYNRLHTSNVNVVNSDRQGVKLVKVRLSTTRVNNMDTELDLVVISSRVFVHISYLTESFLTTASGRSLHPAGCRWVRGSAPLLNSAFPAWSHQYSASSTGSKCNRKVASDIAGLSHFLIHWALTLNLARVRLIRNLTLVFIFLYTCVFFSISAAEQNVEPSFTSIGSPFEHPFPGFVSWRSCHYYWYVRSWIHGFWEEELISRTCF